MRVISDETAGEKQRRMKWRVILNHVVVLCLVFEGTSTLFSIVVAPTDTPTTNVGGSLFSTLSVFAICGVLDDGHSDTCEVTSPGGSDVCFSDNYWYGSSSRVPVDHLYVIYGKNVYSSTLIIFIKSNCLTFFWVLSCMSYSCSVETNPLSII